MSPALLDTDVLSAIMRGEPEAVRRASEYLAVHERLTFSAITRYEILRGLHAKQALAQLDAFDRFAAASQVLPVNDAVIVTASRTYAELYRHGDLIGDADILISATAMEHDLTLVTNNMRHFSRISGLRLENWTKP